MEQHKTKQYISCTETAALVRAALKEGFPGVKFSVRSKSYSGGASIRVEYENGPSVDRVEEVTKRFEGADFDGMQDLKTHKEVLLNGQLVQFGADWVHVNRELSQEVRENVARFLAECYGVPFTSLNTCELGGHYDWHSLVWQYTRGRDFADFCKAHEVQEVAA